MRVFSVHRNHMGRSRNISDRFALRFLDGLANNTITTVITIICYLLNTLCWKLWQTYQNVPGYCLGVFSANMCTCLRGLDDDVCCTNVQIKFAQFCCILCMTRKQNDEAYRHTYILCRLGILEWILLKTFIYNPFYYLLYTFFIHCFMPNI